MGVGGTARAIATLVAAVTVGCGEKTKTATSACSPLADPAVRVMDEAVTSDGRYVILTGTRDPPSRVFYGTSDHLTEGRITDTMVGCFRSVSFVVDGKSYTATFGYAVCNGNVPSRLEPADPGAQRQPMTQLVGPNGFPSDAGAPATGRSFYCF